MTLRDTADQIIRASLRAVQPDAAVQRALQEFSCAGRVVLIAIGKAAWAMANAAWDTLSTRITSGAVITKYGHSRGPIGPLQIFEAGHPVPDEAGLRAAQAALELTRGLREEDWEANGAEVWPQPETSRGRHRASGRMVDAKRWRFLMGTPICCLDSGSFLKNSVWFTEG